MALDVLADADEAAVRAAKAAGVTVRGLTALGELDAMIALFDEIWEPDAGNPSLRLDLVRAMTKAGNYASGAYDAASGQLLGACIGFFGPPSRAELHSHIAGVRPAGLGRSVGFALKVHQRAWALRHGVRVIAWTYDPLIRRNAYFNLVKLGARPVEYLPNFYGVMDDAINGGTETDRMLVHWDLRSAAACEASAGRPRPASYESERSRGAVVALSAGPDGRPAAGGPGAATPLSPGGATPRTPRESPGRATPSTPRESPGRATRRTSGESPGEATPRAPRLLVGVPADIEAMRLSDPPLAAAWRTALRDVMSPLLGDGARVTGFARSGWYVVSASAADQAGRG